MARLYLFAEGRTEQTFADTVLKPHLAECGVYMNKPVLIAHAHKKHRTYRGGGREFRPMQNDICRFLKQDASNDAFFTSMIDLYALHKGFPGIEEAERYRSDPYRRVEALEASWAEETDDPRFVPHIQLHEYEAYLFTDISTLSFFYEDRRREIERLKRIADSFESPELMDEGADTAPSKRIIAQLPRYEHDKATVGVQAAQQIGLSRIRARCPHFSRWVERLEGLGAWNPAGSSQCPCLAYPQWSSRAPHARPSGPEVAEAEGNRIEGTDVHRVVVLRARDQQPLPVAELEGLQRAVRRVDEPEVDHTFAGVDRTLFMAGRPCGSSSRAPRTPSRVRG